MDEKDLIRACQKGNQKAFEMLVRQYEKKVYTLCRRMCRNEEDAREAAQDAFLSLWRGIGTYRSDAAFSTWLYRLTANACLDRLRREKKHTGEVSLDDEETLTEPVDPTPRPEELAEREETRRQIRQALYALPPEQRQILLLRETEQLSYAEIAQVTGLELGTVKSRINRARLALRDRLRESGNFFGNAASKEPKGKGAEQK